MDSRAQNSCTPKQRKPKPTLQINTLHDYDPILLFRPTGALKSLLSPLPFIKPL